LGDIGIFKGGNGFPIKYQGNISGKYPFFKVSDINSSDSFTQRLLRNYKSPDNGERI
jgi:type I restriction enzyme S subunit